MTLDTLPRRCDDCGAPARDPQCDVSLTYCDACLDGTSEAQKRARAELFDTGKLHGPRESERDCGCGWGTFCDGPGLCECKRLRAVLSSLRVSA